MPTAYKRCPKCKAVIERQHKYCELCTPKVKAEHNREYDKSYRNQEAKTFYNSKEWQRVRYSILSKNPFCAVEGCNRPADVVDHIVEIRDGGGRLDLANLQPLCHYHHNIKTAEEKRKR